MNSAVLHAHGSVTPARSLVFDSPNSGFDMPEDFGSARTPDELRDGEDYFINGLYAAAAAKDVSLLAARFPRTYFNVSRHAEDIDPKLLAER